MSHLGRPAKKTVKIIIIALIAAAAVTAAALRLSGAVEIAQFNSRSITDWGLASSVDGVKTSEDVGAYDLDGFKYFSDGDGEGLSSSDGTKYYLAPYLLGGELEVVGFYSTEEYYSVLGIRVGDAELDAKTALLDSGYTMQDGGFNSCAASRGKISIDLTFERGLVTSISARLSTD